MPEPHLTEIYGEDGRLIEAYTPAPLDPAEIEAMLAQSYAERPSQVELADLIMSMEGPTAAGTEPVVGGTAHDPVFTNDIGPSPKFTVPVGELGDVNLDRGAGDDWYGRGPITTKDPQIGYIADDPGYAALSAQPEPGWVGKTDAYDRGWWQQPLGDDIPDEFRDLVGL